MNERRRFRAPTVLTRGTVGDSAILLILASVQCLCAQVLFFACFPAVLAAAKEAVVLRPESSLERRGMMLVVDLWKR